MRPLVSVGWVLALLSSASIYAATVSGSVSQGGNSPMIKLAAPRTIGKMSVEEAIAKRRSIREFTTASVTLENVAQLLWCAQGMTGKEGFRAAPSAGATYPLETYLVAGEVPGLAPGVYRYDPAQHSLILHQQGDVRSALASACLGQEWVKNAPLSIALSAIYERTTKRYGARGRQYVHMEIGHVAQNVYLQATALGLGTVIVGAFEDDRVSKVLALPPNEVPLAVLPIGVPK